MTGFFALSATVCLDVFFLALIAGLLVSSLSAGLIRLPSFRAFALRCPGFLFTMRILPWVLSVLLATTFALPAFLILEPRSTGEVPSAYLLVVALLSLVVISVFLFRLCRSLIETKALLRRWLIKVEPIGIDAPIPIFRVESPGSLFAVVGIFRPRIFVGKQALAALNDQELRAAVAHEQSHVHSFDNLKRLLLHASRLPRWFGPVTAIDSAWSDAAEIAADQRTLAGRISGIDLGSAIVKIGRLRTDSFAYGSGVVSHLVSTNRASSLAGRMALIQSWLNASDDISKTDERHPFLCACLLLAATAYLLTVPFTLPFAHRAIEWFFK